MLIISMFLRTSNLGVVVQIADISHLYNWFGRLLAVGEGGGTILIHTSFVQLIWTTFSCWRVWVGVILTVCKMLVHWPPTNVVHFIGRFFKYILIGIIFHNSNCGTETKGPTAHIGAFMGYLHYLKLWLNATKTLQHISLIISTCPNPRWLKSRPIVISWQNWRTLLNIFCV